MKGDLNSTRTPVRRFSKPKLSKFKNFEPEKKQATTADLENRNKSKLSCLIRKKYTKLMKDSIQSQKNLESVVCCKGCSHLTNKMIFKLSSSIFQAVISIIAVILYIAETYMPNDSDPTTPITDDVLQSFSMTRLQYDNLNSFFSLMEIIIAIIMLLDYIIQFSITKAANKLKFIFSIFNILDITIVVFSALSFFKVDVQNIGFARIFRVVRILRVFRLYKFLQAPRTKNSQDENQNEMTRRLASAIMTMGALLFLSTGLVHYLNENYPEYFRLVVNNANQIHCREDQSKNTSLYNDTLMQTNSKLQTRNISMSVQCPEGYMLVQAYSRINFDHVFYYMVITMTTVGYGDMYPGTPYMRILIGIFIIISIINISKQTSEINDIFRLNTEYRAPFHPSADSKHIVLTGFFCKSSLTKFLNEFYHNDHQEDANIKIVIIQQDYPEKDIQSVLMNPRFEENLHFIIGDIFVEKTLSLAAVESASTVFLLSDQNSLDGAKNDLNLILSCKAFSQYSSNPPIMVQFNNSQSLLHDWADWDVACSSHQIKMSIIIKNGFVNGFSTMLMNLISSSANDLNAEIKETPWMEQYLNGASQEIYIVKLPKNEDTKESPYKGVNFLEFATKAYINTEVLVIGVKLKMKYPHDETIFYDYFLLNPVNYSFKTDDELIIIAPDSGIANTVFDDKSNQPLSKYFRYPLKSEYEKMDFLDKFIKINTFPDNDKDALIIDKNSSYDGKALNNSFSGSESDSSESSEDENKKENANKKTSELKKNKHVKGIFEKRKHFKIWENNNEDLGEHFRDHYMIFCKEEHLFEFMQIFDKYYSGIVFYVSDQHPSHKWEVMQRYYENLIYIECSYTDQDDLKKLHLNESKHVYILTWAVENSNVSDSGILPLVKIIEDQFKKCSYTLELSDELNVRYLNNNKDEEEKEDSFDLQAGDNKKENDEDDDDENSPSYEKIPPRLWPKYAKSEIFFSSSLDSILAISYYNKGLLDVLLKMVGIGSKAESYHIKKTKELKSKEQRRLSEIAEEPMERIDLIQNDDEENEKDKENKEEVFERAFPKREETKTFGRFSTIVREKKAAFLRDEEILENDFINMVKYTGKDKVNYGKIFEAFIQLDDPLICMGIYRATKDLNYRKFLKNNSGYIITNPKHDDIVYEGDMIVVIGTTDALNSERSFEEQRGIEPAAVKTFDKKWITTALIKNSPNPILTKYLGDIPIESFSEAELMRRVNMELENIKSLADGTTDIDFLLDRESERRNEEKKKNELGILLGDQKRFNKGNNLPKPESISIISLANKEIETKEAKPILKNAGLKSDRILPIKTSKKKLVTLEEEENINVTMGTPRNSQEPRSNSIENEFNRLLNFKPIKKSTDSNGLLVETGTQNGGNILLNTESKSSSGIQTEPHEFKINDENNHINYINEDDESLYGSQDGRLASIDTESRKGLDNFNVIEFRSEPNENDLKETSMIILKNGQEEKDNGR